LNYNHGTVMTNVVLRDNSATFGAGMFNNYGSATLTNVLINNNSASIAGGIYNTNSSPILTNVTISNNTGSGRGIYNTSNSSPIIRNSILWNIGGTEVANFSNSTPSFINSIVRGSGGSGAWLSSYGTDSGNNLDVDPLFVDAANGDFTLQACSQGIGQGSNAAVAGIATDLAGNTRIQQTTVDMGAYESAFAHSIIVTPSVAIVSNDADNSIITGTSVTFTATPTNGGTTPSYQWKKNGNNVVGGTAPTYTDATLANGDVITVVMTSNAACATTATATSNAITMTVSSPCASFSGRIYVTQGGTGNGSSWANATGDLQAAIDNTCGITEIWVKQGTYKPIAFPTGCTNCGTNTRNYAFHVKSGISIYGGFAGTETMLSQRNIAANTTTLSGDIGAVGNNADNCYRVVIASSPSSGGGVTIDGFTITGGNTSGSGSITLSGNFVSSNRGAGIYIIYGTNTLTNNTIANNSAIYGGGIYADVSTNTMTNNTLYNNVATDGGALLTLSSNNTLTNNTLYNNSASRYGGGTYSYYGTNTLTNNTFHNNSATNNGGGVYAEQGITTLTNNIFWQNKKGGNSSIAGADIQNYNNTNTLTISYCLTQANSNYASGTGIINNQDPLFTNAANGDFSLQVNSPAINIGSDVAWTATSLTTDAAGNTRPVGVVDMGAFEYAQMVIPLVVSSTVTSVSCFGSNTGSIQITVSGGTAPYTYLWNNGSTAQNRNKLIAGIYTVTVTDSNGDTETINAIVTQPASALAASITTSKTCNDDGTINLTVSGGTAPYAYSWSNGSTTPNLSGLSAGLYTVIITDVNGCKISRSRTVAAEVQIKESVREVSCNGGTNGRIRLTITGGQAPYTYLWSNGSTTQNITGLSAGIYTVTVTDLQGCTSSSSISVTQPLPITITPTIVESIRNGATGSITLTVTGGTAPYVYLWDDGSTLQNRTALAKGRYTVTVTDANNCSQSLRIIVPFSSNITAREADDNAEVLSEVLSEERLEAAAASRIYPNPATTFFNVTLENNQMHEVQINVFSSLGQVVHTQIATDNNTLISTANWVNGVYHVQVRMKDKVQTHTVIVQR
jgi:parallel beta-helix repeat protein/predicted outer membrane repeat protein